MKPQPETLHRTCLIAHTAPAEIHTRTQHHARILHRSAADHESRPTVRMSVLTYVGGTCDEEELAAMDAVVHWFGD